MLIDPGSVRQRSVWCIFALYEKEDKYYCNISDYGMKTVSEQPEMPECQIVPVSNPVGLLAFLIGFCHSSNISFRLEHLMADVIWTDSNA